MQDLGFRDSVPRPHRTDINDSPELASASFIGRLLDGDVTSGRSYKVPRHGDRDDGILLPIPPIIRSVGMCFACESWLEIRFVHRLGVSRRKCLPLML